jgi:hypothetical protein
MSPESGDRYAKLMRKAIKSLPEDEQDFVLEHLLKGGNVGGGPGKEIRTEVRKIRRSEGGGDIEIEDLEPIMIRLKKRHGEGEPETRRREVFVERVKGPLSQMVPMRLSDDQHARFKKWCEEHDTSMAEIVRTLIERFLDEQTASD